MKKARTLPVDAVLADLARLVREAEAEPDPLAAALGRAVRDGWFRHVLSLGVGPETPGLVRAAWSSPHAVAVSVVSHDPAEGTALMDVTGVETLLSTFILSIAPAVVRDVDGERVAVYDLGSIVPASHDPADLVVVRGLPVELGGRRGALLQGLEFCRAGTALLVPDVAKAERPAVGRWQGAVAAAGGAAASLKVGKRRLATARLAIDRD